MSHRDTASQAKGTNGIAIIAMLEGMCVNTIVFTNPILRANRTATPMDTAVSTADPKNIKPRDPGSMPNFVKKKYAARLCATRPVPKLSTLKRPARVNILRRDLSLNGFTHRVATSLISTSEEIEA